MSEPSTAFILFLVGLLVGFGFFKLAQRQIKVRCEALPQLAEDYNPAFLNQRWVLPVWEVLFGGLFAASALIGENWLQVLFFTVYISCAVNIAMVDIAIRRIPNELLLAVLIARIVYVVGNHFISGEAPKMLLQNAVLSVIGLVGGFIIYLIPSKFGIYIGSGDIKLSAVIGFAVGIISYFQAMAVMAVIMLAYLIILIVTKKGGRKSYAPMGPALAAGALVTMFFPLFSSSVKLF